MASASLPETYKTLRSHGFGTQPVFDEVPLQKPGKNQVLVKMEYAPLHATDIEAMYGYYSSFLPTPYTVGAEGSGTIVAIGEDLKKPHKVGDKVHVFGISFTGGNGRGTLGEYYLGDSETCSLVEGNITMQEAAVHFINPGTAYYMSVLAQKGNHKAAIYTAGSSTLGRMLIRLFKLKGIKLITVVRNEKHIEELKKEGADYVLNSQDPDFEKQLKEIAAKEQATIAFEPISGDFTAKVLGCMPPRSILYVHGALSNEREIKINIYELILGKTISGLLVLDFVNELYKDGKLTETFKEVHSLLPTVLRSRIQKEFNMADFNEAVAFYHQNSSNGKILIKFH